MTEVVYTSDGLVSVSHEHQSAWPPEMPVQRQILPSESM
jgi:hypothetical protein